jgi:hypothetical protein
MLSLSSDWATLQEAVRGPLARGSRGVQRSLFLSDRYSRLCRPGEIQLRDWTGVSGEVTSSQASAWISLEGLCRERERPTALFNLEQSRDAGRREWGLADEDHARG